MRRRHHRLVSSRHCRTCSLGEEDFLHPNASAFSSPSQPCSPCTSRAKATVWRWPALFLGTTLLRTLSKSSIIAFVAALGFACSRTQLCPAPLRSGSPSPPSLILASLWGLLDAYLNTYTETTNPETLTGRTIIWAISLEYRHQKTLLGHGFYSYRFVVPPSATSKPNKPTTNSSSSSSPSEPSASSSSSALLGLLPPDSPRSPVNLKTLAAELLLFALVRGLTDTQNFDLSFPLWLMTMLSILLAATPPPPDASIQAD